MKRMSRRLDERGLVCTAAGCSDRGTVATLSHDTVFQLAGCKGRASGGLACVSLCKVCAVNRLRLDVAWCVGVALTPGRCWLSFWQPWKWRGIFGRAALVTMLIGAKLVTQPSAGSECHARHLCASPVTRIDGYW